MHFLNNHRKRNITNNNLVPGILQWTRFESRGIPINLFTIYLSGRSDDYENDQEAINSFINAVLTCKDEHIILSGDLNIDTQNPTTTREKDWIWILEMLKLTEFKTPNYTWIRRSQGTLIRSRPDHIFVSKNIRVVKEVIMTPLTTNDHVPFYLDLEFKSNLTWRTYFSKNKRKRMYEAINKCKIDNFQELNQAIEAQIIKYGSKVDRLGVGRISTAFKEEIQDLEDEILSKINNPNIPQSEIQELQTLLKETHINNAKEIKEKLIDEFNDNSSSRMYQFDKMIHSNQIMWKDLNFEEEEIVDYFTNKFTSTNQQPTFTPSNSTIKEGPDWSNSIHIKELQDALKRMKSNTSGPDLISLDIIKHLTEANQGILLEEYNRCLRDGDIPQNWKQGWKAQEIDRAIRGAIRRKLLMDRATPTSFFHLPLEEGGLPSIEEFSERMNLRTMNLIANNKNKLIRKACEETKDNIYAKWLSVLKEYNLTFVQNDTKFRIAKIKTGNSFDIHTDGSRINQKTGMGINIYDTSNRSVPFTIHTDSEVAIEVLKDRYKGDFLTLKEAFFRTIKNRKIEYEIKKVEAHKDSENIKVDLIAKNATTRDDIFDICNLLKNQHLLVKDGVVIFNHKKMTITRHLSVRHNKMNENPNFILNQSWDSLNVQYLKTRLTPKTKYFIWRNSINAHINFGKGKSFCYDCGTESDLFHYIHECPGLDSARYFCQSKISDILEGRECLLSHFQFKPEKHHHALHFHHNGITSFEDGYMQFHKDIAKKWPEIQGAISNFVGRSYSNYYIDSK
ncbi:predicted protein [Naegleria gruberi]|uniref:Predicted protein n=2 Tax=Naegleria gruberi TaxID=5762 RepID=D2VRZ9_NAEGR|nr:uncharacterized protein NAEGRDRAFT_71761 [Naegleria gruberi]EFC40260.1 predicted protein [Naegleria gruberi]|eukprot:XP_002673004.1 predicted protein [Naegleria gruberi strain NEG-M]